MPFSAPPRRSCYTQRAKTTLARARAPREHGGDQVFAYRMTSSHTSRGKVSILTPGTQDPKSDFTASSLHAAVVDARNYRITLLPSSGYCPPFAGILLADLLLYAFSAAVELPVVRQIRL